jgi:hypothetical protein
MISNKAGLGGDNDYSVPLFLGFGLTPDGQVQTSLTLNIKSGEAMYTPEIVVCIYDERRRLYSYNSQKKTLEAQVMSLVNPEITFEGKSLAVAYEGVFKFSSLRVIGEPGTSVNLAVVPGADVIDLEKYKLITK